jgi:predicted nucleic acid-binding protein
MTGTAFVDTNVLVYGRDLSESVKQPRAEAWLNYLWNERAGRVSFQVLDEFYVTVTRKLKPGLDRHAATREMRSFFAWRPIPLDAATLQGAWRIEDAYGFSFWDSLIVSAALLGGCRYLLTEDLQDGQAIDGVHVVDPFAHTPEDLD